MAANPHGARVNNPSEETALLSGISDIAPISDYAASSQQQTTSTAQDISLEDGPNHAISFARSMSIALSLFCLIFLHST